MLKNKKIGFIGIGNMGQAIINGLLASNLIDKNDIIAYDCDSKKRDIVEKKGIKIAGSSNDLISKADIIILAVKPQIIGNVLNEIKMEMKKSQTIISIAAGITIKYIENLLGDKIPVMRVMPNTPALVKEGMTAICRGKFATGKDEKIAEKIFSSVGKTIKIRESLMDAVTGLSGSGPAYIFFIIEALIEAGKQVGLSKSDAEILTKQTLLGAAKMVIETGEDAAVLRRKVTSPGGTTEAALNYLNKEKFTQILIEAVKVATKKSKELGKR